MFMNMAACLYVALFIFLNVLQCSYSLTDDISDDEVSLKILFSKILELENKEANFKRQLENLENEVTQQRRHNQKLEFDNKRLAKDINDLKFQAQHRHQEIRATGADQHIAFFATLNKSFQILQKDQLVLFDNVVTNIGNAYDTSNGEFVAPVQGTYVFTTTITTYGQETSFYALSVNNTTLTRIYVNGGDADEDDCSQSVVLQLQHGDVISVKHLGVDLKTIKGDDRSLFSGFLLNVATDPPTIVG